MIRVGAVALISALLLSNDVLAESEFAELQVTGLRQDKPGIVYFDPMDVTIGIPADGGEAIRSVPGVSGIRMGGHGIDPAIRGQSQGRINILLDGSFVEGGCPNRMDPASSYAPTTTYNKVTVAKGGQTLRHGEGGSGGIVLYERETPRLTTGEFVRGRADAGFGTNGDHQSYSADITAGKEKYFARGIGSFSRANSYKDGDGNTVPSAYQSYSAAGILGYTPSDTTRGEIHYEFNRAEDVLFPGALMDSPETENQMLKGKFAWEGGTDTVQGVRVEVYRSDIDHLMDTYSLREPVQGLPLRKAPTQTESTNGRLFFDLRGGEIDFTLGADFHLTNHQAERLMGQNPESVTMLQSVLWPDVDTSKFGLIGEGKAMVGEGTTLHAGVRYDYIDVSAGAVNEKPVGMNLSPAELYHTYYGLEDTSRTENNLSGFFRLEQELLSNQMQGYLAASYITRSADQTEAYIASNGMKPPMRWVGNPAVNPEKHTQLEGGVLHNTDRAFFSAALFYDWVDDFVLRDRARGQEGILQSDLATIYRNVRASLWGGELDGRYLFTNEISGRVALWYVHGTNESDDRPIAQIPPLEGLGELEYARERWKLGGRIRFAAKQTRVDDDPTTGSGLDAGETPGWGVVDIYGEAAFNKHIRLQLGISNLLDETYAQHLNKSNALDPVQVQVNEPGRSFWLRLVGAF